MEGIGELIRFLQSGNRMEKPEYAPKAIGDIMTECWKQNQEERIDFEKLERILGEMVDPSIQDQFAGIAAPEPEPKNAPKSGGSEEGINYIQMSMEEDEMPAYLDMNSEELAAVVPPPQRPPKLITQLSLRSMNSNTRSPPQTPLSAGIPMEYESDSHKYPMSDYLPLVSVDEFGGGEESDLQNVEHRTPRRPHKLYKEPSLHQNNINLDDFESGLPDIYTPKMPPRLNRQHSNSVEKGEPRNAERMPPRRPPKLSKQSSVTSSNNSSTEAAVPPNSLLGDSSKRYERNITICVYDIQRQ